MVIARPGRSADAAVRPETPVEDGADGSFLCPRGMGVSPGEESSGRAVADKAVEASADPGQIKPREAVTGMGVEALERK